MKKIQNSKRTFSPVKSTRIDTPPKQAYPISNHSLLYCKSWALGNSLSYRQFDCTTQKYKDKQEGKKSKKKKYSAQCTCM